MEIFQPAEITEELFNAFKKLIPQLYDSSKIPTKEYLQEIIQSKNIHLFVAKENEIIGSLTLVMYKIPTGRKAWIEDVVVDADARGKGIGKKLILHAIAYVRKEGIKQIDLTSNPSRLAANNLYQKLGFGKRNTNVYRMTFSKVKNFGKGL